MKRLTTAIAALAFAGSASAYDATNLYNGTQIDNPDLYGGYAVSEMATASQPGIGDRFEGSSWSRANSQTSYDVYTTGNPDTYSGRSASAETMAVGGGIGDRSNSLRSRSDFSSTSYDMWVDGNPDQESSF